MKNMYAKWHEMNMAESILPSAKWEHRLLDRYSETVNAEGLADFFGGMMILKRRTEESSGSILLEMDSAELEFCCPDCGQKLRLHHGKKVKQVRDLPVFEYQVTLNVTVYEYECRNEKQAMTGENGGGIQSDGKHCRVFTSDAGGFLLGRCAVTKRCWELASMLGIIMSCSNASLLLEQMGISFSDDTVNRWQKTYLKQYGAPELLRELPGENTTVDQHFLKNMEQVLREDFPEVMLCRKDEERRALMAEIIRYAWAEAADSVKNSKMPLSRYERRKLEKMNSFWK